MQESVSQALYSYWNDLRGDRVAPKRFEIEPSCISGNLPDTFILERIAPATLRFRLAGTRISEAFGIDFRGVNLFRLFDDADARIVQQQIALSASDGAVCVFRIMAGSASGLSTEFELLILPLMHTRDTIDRFLGALTPIDRPNRPRRLASAARNPRQMAKIAVTGMNPSTLRLIVGRLDFCA